ncbi:hypothetical protein BGZ82_000143 [Podila clonocystis]|nr:hypothetical protein BGZ82_000143 [Podila clonocystis]
MVAEHTLNKDPQQQRSANNIRSGTGTGSRAITSTGHSSSTEAGSSNEPTATVVHGDAMDLRDEINNLMIQKQERPRSPEATSATQAKPSQSIRVLHSAGEYSLQVEIKIQVKIKELKEAIKKSIEGTASTSDEERLQREISQQEESVKVSEQDEECVENEILQTTKE